MKKPQETIQLHGGVCVPAFSYGISICSVHLKDAYPDVVDDMCHGQDDYTVTYIKENLTPADIYLCAELNRAAYDASDVEIEACYHAQLTMPNPNFKQEMKKYKAYLAKQRRADKKQKEADEAAKEAEEQALYLSLKKKYDTENS